MIGSGGFASVHDVYWKNTQVKFAIKKFIKSSKKEIDNEIRLTEMVNFHPNIIRFCGVTKLEGETNYSLVLEYANGGTLGKYLRDNAETFKWENQLKFAKDIASAVLCLHDKGIIHRDLHSDNILIHQHTIKLADFGCSYLQGSDCYTEPRGVVPYVDPKFFNIQKTESHSYNLTEKSDIYSLGVIFWELTSRSSPFDFKTKNDPSIMSKIFDGEREHPIPNTNGKFIKLYQKCWQPEPDERLTIDQVISELENVDSENNNVSTNFNFKESEATAEKPKDENRDIFSDCYLSNYDITY